MTAVPLDHLAALAVAQDAYLGLLADADPEAAVPTCGDWRVADLTAHLAGVHWWAAAMALGLDLDAEPSAGPRDVPALVRVYAWAASHLRGTLAELDPASPALTLLGPGPAGFWRRRQLHETLVHLTDLAVALGVADAADLDPVWWADTVDEVVTVTQPRQVRLGRMRALDAGVHWSATDTGDDWLLGPADAVAATVRGPARELALTLWGRVQPTDPRLRVDGDAGALARVLAEPLTP
ncbi:hypothetical protein AGMMS50218_15060 [Actinomycetota bacterium]|nr:hypothetical protein AGMMS50218_15060 [Actinomycetota bacterium]